MVDPRASNWVDRGEPPEPTLTRVLASYLELEPLAHAAQLREYAGAVRGMAEADANTRSVRLAERLGEHLDGEAVVHGCRVEVYVLLSSAWRAA